MCVEGSEIKDGFQKICVCEYLQVCMGDVLQVILICNGVNDLVYTGFDYVRVVCCRYI